MSYFSSEIRTHAFQTVHDFETFEDFEAEMVAFGESLPPITSPTAKDPHYRYTCRSTARWAWERRETIVPYNDFIAGKRVIE